MKCLSVKNLSYSYNDKSLVVDNVSFDINRGEYVSLVGHNGCGKSTLAKLLVGLLTSDKGEINILGHVLSKDTINEIRKHVAIVFQNPDNQFIGATVEDDIAFSLENMNVPREQMAALVKEYAQRVGMGEFLFKEPSYLSGGQKQRVAIADALVRNPDILILDESTSMLDPSGKAEILSLIKKMREDNRDLTVISITHDIEEAYESDRIILMDNGHIVLTCTPNELFNNVDTINKYNLAVPFIVKLKKQISDLGIKVSDNDTLDTLGEKLCKLK